MGLGSYVVGMDPMRLGSYGVDGSHGVGLDPMGFAVADGSHWVAGLWLGSLITPRAP